MIPTALPRSYSVYLFFFFSDLTTRIYRSRLTRAALRLDSNFSPLLNQSAEQIRRRVISLLMEGGGGEGGGTQGGDVIKAPPEFGGAAAGPGLATVVEMQESEIATLKHELSEALSRVPRGGGESALEAALKKQVYRYSGEVRGHRLVCRTACVCLASVRKGCAVYAGSFFFVFFLLQSLRSVLVYTCVHLSIFYRVVARSVCANHFVGIFLS